MASDERPRGNGRHKELIARALKANPTLKAHGFRKALLEAVTAEGYVVDEDLDDMRGSPIPDAWAMDPKSMTISVWEVCVTNPQEASEAKWEELAWILDCIDVWTLEIIIVDRRGICSRSTSTADVWRVDEPAPFELCPHARWTKRGTPRSEWPSRFTASNG